ncbi:DNRLRE domain-containing protein [Candidatus Woesearchaeota archaeon]|nr:DNRLRE domain-containing protein [Candidatus Woesearchaeota archaeon]
MNKLFVVFVIFILFPASVSAVYSDFRPTDDTFVRSSAWHKNDVNKNFASYGFLAVDSQYITPVDLIIPAVFKQTSRTYMKFDISAIPDDATIEEAWLSLGVTGSTGYGLGLYRVSNDLTTGQPWTEDNIVWNNAPTNWDRGTTTTLSRGIYSINIIPGEIQAMLRENTISFAIKILEEDQNIVNAVTRTAYFCGMGYYSNSGCCTQSWCGDTQPHLYVVYSLPSCNRYSTWEDCERDDRCGWCLKCANKKYSGAPDRCLPIGQCPRSCTLGECDAQCDSKAEPTKACDGDMLYTHGVCDPNTCTTSSLSKDCNDDDGWERTSQKRWITVGNKEKQQRQEELRDYYCANNKCTYMPLQSRWVFTGWERNVNCNFCFIPTHTGVSNFFSNIFNQASTSVSTHKSSQSSAPSGPEPDV